MTNHLDVENFKITIGQSKDRIERFSTLFEASFHEQIDAIEASLNSQDFETLRTSAHSLKGAAANMHALTIHQLALDIEQQAKKHTTDNIANWIAALKRALPDYLAELDRFKETLE